MTKKIIAANVATLLILTTLLSAIATATEYDKEIDIQPSGPYNYDLNKENPVNFTVYINTTETISSAVLETNEDLEKTNYTRYTENINSTKNGTKISYQWDNGLPVTTQRKFNFTPFITTENGETFSTGRDGTITASKEKNLPINNTSNDTYWSNWDNVIDGNTTTFGTVEGTGMASFKTADGIINYSNTASDYKRSYRWKVKDGAGNHTLEIPETCVDNKTIQTEITSHKSDLASNYARYSCYNYNTSEYTQLYNNTYADGSNKQRVYWENIKAEKVTEKLENTIEISLTPTLHSLNLEDVPQGENALMSVKATHPVGYAEIERVEFDVENPDGQTSTYIARREDSLTINGDNGNLYESFYTETEETGYYDVTAKVITESKTVAKNDTFTIEEAEPPERPEVNLRPFNIGSTSWVTAGAEVAKVNVIYRIAIGLQLMIIATTSAIILGGAGYEEAEYENLGSQNTGYRT